MTGRLLQYIERYVEQHNIVEYGDRIVAGVSGGADSVCLLAVLCEWRIRYALTIYAVHINHGIRGVDANADEQYVEQLCRKWDVPFFSFHEDVEALAARQHISTEEAGRNVRYACFQKICQQEKCNKIAVAHNKNDNAETVLFHLFRGSGMQGLTGIAPVREQIIRPLLCLERSEIEAYLQEKNIAFRNDHTNMEDIYTRNKIRHRILEYGRQEINPQLVRHIAEASEAVSEAWAYIERQADAAYSSLVKNRSFFISDFEKEEPVIQKEILRRMIKELASGLKDVESVHITMLLELIKKETGKEVHLPYRITARREYDRFYMEKIVDIDEEKYEISLQIPGCYSIPGMNAWLELERKEAGPKNIKISKNDYTKVFDYDRINTMVLLRNRRPGDFLEINAQGGRKKLKDLFIDRKYPRQKRERIPLLADGNHIMWVLGDRISEYYKVSSETKEVLIAHIRIQE